MNASDAVVRARRVQFASRLRDLRREAGLSQEVVAHQAGLDRSFYVEIETAKHSVMLDRVYDIAAALGVSVRDLFLEQ